MDRFDCSTAIADSWKQQMLLNIVKLRYMDLPVFVDVSSVVSGYSMQTGANINGTLSSQNAVQGNFGSLGGQGHLYRPPHHHLCALDRGRSSSAGLSRRLTRRTSSSCFKLATRDGDWQTKRALTAVMFFFILAGKVVEETADSVVFDSELGGKLCESELTPRTPRP